MDSGKISQVVCQRALRRAPGIPPMEVNGIASYPEHEYGQAEDGKQQSLA
jgi:hypothetical protein